MQLYSYIETVTSRLLQDPQQENAILTGGNLERVQAEKRWFLERIIPIQRRFEGEKTPGRFGQQTAPSPAPKQAPTSATCTLIGIQNGSDQGPFAVPLHKQKWSIYNLLKGDSRVNLTEGRHCVWNVALKGRSILSAALSQPSAWQPVVIPGEKSIFTSPL